MTNFLIGLIIGAVLGAGAILYLVRRGKLDAKKAADELAAIANKAKQK